MLETRVAQLEQQPDKIEDLLNRLHPRIVEMHTYVFTLPKTSDLTDINSKISYIEGRVQNMPTTWQLATFVISACLGAAGLAFTIARLFAS